MEEGKAKILIYDFDKSLRTLGSDEKIKSSFGYAPRRFENTESFDKFFSDIHKFTRKESEDELGKVIEDSYTPVKPIDIEVLDSITQLATLMRKEVRGESAKKKLTQADWGQLGEMVEDTLIKLCSTSNHMVIIGHTKWDKEEDTGMFKYMPSISGRMANEFGRYFDIVAFTRIQKNATTGATEYMWQIVPDEKRTAKCRLRSVFKYCRNGMIPQDFGLFELDKHESLKIAIIGEPGTGKTHSLSTFKKYITNNQ